MEKTAILGGSFDPVHLGHLYLLHNAVLQTDYTRFILVPAKVSNFKIDSKPVSTDEDRLNMLNLALEDYAEIYPDDGKQIITSDIELKRGGISYTYDTIIQIKKQYGIKDRIGLIVGDDHIATLPKWYKYNDLVKDVEFIICPRNHEEDLKKIPTGITYQVLHVKQTKIENATEVRNNFDKYLSYLSRRVMEYARERNLYS